MLKRTTPSKSSHADFGDFLLDAVTPTSVIRRRSKKNSLPLRTRWLRKRRHPPLRHPMNKIDLP